MSGRVYLVGAGPGDTELLTIKALRILRAADVVLHDELVAREILELAPSTARIRNVGKRCGAKAVSQHEINQWMVRYAAAGLTVVRLKGGDPLVFGRAGEEIAALRAAGIPCEVVPGVTAALGAAAAAQVPLTHRDIAPAVLLVTYRRAAQRPPLDWQAILASGATIVLYMPGNDYGSISRDLRDAGLDRHTPCVIASSVTTPLEKINATTLEQLAAVTPLPPPTLLVIGPVAHLAKAASSAGTKARSAIPLALTSAFANPLVFVDPAAPPSGPAQKSLRCLLR